MLTGVFGLTSVGLAAKCASNMHAAKTLIAEGQMAGNKITKTAFQARYLDVTGVERENTVIGAAIGNGAFSPVVGSVMEDEYDGRSTRYHLSGRKDLTAVPCYNLNTTEYHSHRTLNSLLEKLGHPQHPFKGEKYFRCDYHNITDNSLMLVDKNNFIQAIASDKDSLAKQAYPSSPWLGLTFVSSGLTVLSYMMSYT